MLNKLSNAKQEHINKFGIEPYIIGMFWNNPDYIVERINKAIKDNEPYNEYEMLSKDEKKLYDEEKLFF